MTKGMHGASPSLDAWVSLNIYWGCTWASPSLSVWYSRIFFHHLPSHTWKLPSYITHCRLIREISALLKIISHYCKWRFPGRATISLACPKVFAKKKQAYDLQNCEKENRDRSWEKQNIREKRIFLTTCSIQLAFSPMFKVFWFEWQKCLEKILFSVLICFSQFQSPLFFSQFCKS